MIKAKILGESVRPLIEGFSKSIPIWLKERLLQDAIEARESARTEAEIDLIKAELQRKYPNYASDVDEEEAYNDELEAKLNEKGKHPELNLNRPHHPSNKKYGHKDGKHVNLLDAFTEKGINLSKAKFVSIPVTRGSFVPPKEALTPPNIPIWHLPDENGEAVGSVYALGINDAEKAYQSPTNREETFGNRANGWSISQLNKKCIDFCYIDLSNEKVHQYTKADNTIYTDEEGNPVNDTSSRHVLRGDNMTTVRQAINKLVSDPIGKFGVGREKDKAGTKGYDAFGYKYNPDVWYKVHNRDKSKYPKLAHLWDDFEEIMERLKAVYNGQIKPAIMDVLNAGGDVLDSVVDDDAMTRYTMALNILDNDYKKAKDLCQQFVTAVDVINNTPVNDDQTKENIEAAISLITDGDTEDKPLLTQLNDVVEKIESDIGSVTFVMKDWVTEPYSNRRR